jgi:Zn-dependent protease with chaperone function
LLQADYFDGRSTRVRVVSLSVAGEDLHVAGEGVDFHMRFAEVKVDERLGRAPRNLRFKDGAFCEVRDLDALDSLLRSARFRDGRVDRLQRNLQFVLFSCVACVLIVFAAYRWGLPWAAAEGAKHLPPALGKTLSAQTLKILDGAILSPSKLDPARQSALEAKFQALRLQEGGAPQSALLFRRSPQLGANAFTLPDGTIIVLDDLVTVIGEDEQILAVLAHELGHVHGRHGLQLLLRSSAVGAFWTFYIGDIGSLLAAAPAAVVEARYSQELEQQADDYGAALLRHNDLSPALLADALQKLAASHPGASKGGYLASHPPTDERIRRIRSSAAASTPKQSHANQSPAIW